MKKISLFIFLMLLIVFVSGCSNEEEKIDSGNVTGSTTIKQTIVEDDFNENGTGNLKCTTETKTPGNIDVDVNYNISYKRGNILKLISIQKVISSDSEQLDIYEKAYSDIEKHYVGLEYYDTSLIRDDNSVSYTIVIDYDNIDTDKLLDIEGEEDNIIVNGKAKLSLWLELAGKMGTVCEEV